MRVPFCGPSYTARSLNADTQRSLNCYPEMDNNSPRAVIAMYGTPGMTFLGAIGSGPIRAMLREGQTTYVVSGSEVYSVVFTVGYVATKRGDVGTATGPIGIASSGPEVLIVDGTAGWIVTTATNIMTVIADVDFPTGVTRAAFQDGWFLVTGDGTQKFYKNESPYNGMAWNGLDFASAEGSPDKTINVLSDHRELWLFGDSSVELWVNTGNASFPFERSGNTFIEHGCAAADSVAKLENTMFWLGTDDRGGGVVWKAQGYTPVRVSTHGVEKALQSYTTVSDARAFTYQQEGHAFYVLNFPTADRTWVYDSTTDQWHERSWREPTFGTDHMWRAACHVFWNFDHLVGDYQVGNFYKLELGSNLDQGNPIKRLRTTQTMEKEQKRLFFPSLQVDMETGNGGTLSLRYSNDGGHSWSSAKTASMGSTQDARVIFKNLGSGRNRTWEISTISDAKFAVFGAVADVEAGLS